MIKFYIPHTENLYKFQNTKYYIKIVLQCITVAKTCEKVLWLNMTPTTKVQVEKIIRKQ